MRKLMLLILVLCFFLISCLKQENSVNSVQTETATVFPSTLPSVIATTPSEPSRTTMKYEVLDGFLQNPERGFSSEANLDEVDLGEYYEDGVTLVYLTVRLDDYRDGRIPSDFLDEISNFFKSVRSSGVKVILRFSYNDGPFPNPESDAALDQILIHISQLEPILKANADVIVWLEAGFIGAWGEWHASTNGLDENKEAKHEILTALLDAMPRDRAVLLRYPVDIINLFPIPLSINDAFDYSNQSRVGFHNDCFLASPDDEKTYSRNGEYDFSEEMDYLKMTTQFVPVGGESCAYNPPRSDCPSALKELSMLHFSELGDGWHPDVLESWEEQGCYTEIEDRLGYRLLLNESLSNDVVSPGGIIHVSVNVQNVGFAPLMNPRPLFLVMDGIVRYEAMLPIDPRRWAPGLISSFEVKIRVPSGAPEGVYQMYLWLPDFYPSLQDDSRYSVAFANEGVWDSITGYNRLRSITIDANAAGSVDSAAMEFKVLK